MLKFKYLFSNLSVINVLLMAVILLFVAYFMFPLFTMPVKYSLPPKERTHTEGKKTDVAERDVPSPADYVNIAEENLFHPERKIPPEKKEEQQPLPKPEFVLYGTVLTDTVGLAYVEDRKAPRSTPGRGNRQTALRKGDSMSGFVLKEIEADKIVMVRGEERLVVYVRDKNAPKPRDAGTPAPAAKTVQRPQRPQQAPTPPRPAIAPRRQTERPETTTQPPLNPEEQSIVNLFDKGRQE